LALLLALAACGDGNRTDDRSAGEPPLPMEEEEAISNQWKFEVKSGALDMRITSSGTDSGVPAATTLTALFDDHGARMATHWAVGPGDTMHMILNDGMVTNYNPAEGTGMRLRAAPQIRNGLPHLPDEIAMEEIRKRPTYKDLGTRTILGKEAHGYSLDSAGVTTTVWEWKRIPLLMETSGAAATRHEVTRLETDLVLPAERFNPPNGLTIRDVPQDTAARKR